MSPGRVGGEKTVPCASAAIDGLWGPRTSAIVPSGLGTASLFAFWRRRIVRAVFPSGARILLADHRRQLSTHHQTALHSTSS
jgi:hypothetical protein